MSTAVFLAFLTWLTGMPGALAQPDTAPLIASAKGLYNNGDFDGSREALQLVLSKQDSNSVGYAICLQNLALIEYMNFNFQESERLYLKALPLTESLCGPESMATANNLYGLSRCLRRSCRYAEAESCLSRVLEIRTKLLGENHLLVTNSLQDMAVNYSRQNKNAEAVLYSSKAVQSRENALGKDSPFLIPSLKLYAHMLHLSNDSQAGAVDARVQALSSSFREPPGRDPSRREEDGSTWQNVARAPGP